VTLLTQSVIRLTKMVALCLAYLLRIATAMRVGCTMRPTRSVIEDSVDLEGVTQLNVPPSSCASPRWRWMSSYRV